MSKISAKDVAKLRKMTGAGMMDCKKALTETEGDFDAAIDLLRTKGQKIAGKRADREASEGAVLAKVSEDAKTGILIALNCETDFVAKNDAFVSFAQSILDVAVENGASTIEDIKALALNGSTVDAEITRQTGVIGEKVELSYAEKISAESVVAYIHAGNKLAVIAGFNQAGFETQVARDVAMQVAAMNPIAVNSEEIPEDVIAKELQIGKDQAIEEGKPAEMAEKIAKGRLNKFFKESTLEKQAFIKDNKKTVADYLKDTDKGLKVISFKRFGLS